MCGIAGFWLEEGADAARLEGLTRRLSHRGPDRIKTHLDGPVGLGHARLSIIDLEGGDQPLFAEDGNLALVANGEIYNHVELRAELEALGAVFATHSDCEAILHAYRHFGEDFLNRLNGMFAFALHDKRAGRLLLARDRLGIKPLFFAQTPEGLYFASEQKALFPVLGGPKVNPAALLQALETGFNTGAGCIAEGVERLRPGEVAVVERGRVAARRRYWSPLGIAPQPLEYPEAAARFEALMGQAMLEHMRADVPFALFLSGGIDSSVVLEWLRREGGTAGLAAFTVAFADAPNNDDLDAAKTIAARFGLRHQVVGLDRDALFRHLPFAAWAADDFIVDHAILPTSLLAREAARDFKVVFSGEGGDELFAGYGRHRRGKPQRWLASLLAPGSGGYRTRGMLGRAGRGGLLGPALRGAQAARRQGFIDAWQAAPAGWTDLQKMQHTDLATELPDQLLVKVDRTLMAWGLEGRVPLLDHRLAEFALGLPDGLKVQGREGKVFLKRWAGPVYGEELVRRPKRGFSVPVGACLSGDNLTRLAQVLPRHPGLAEWFRPEGVAALIGRQAAKGDVAEALWALLHFAVWHQVFALGGGERPPVFADPVEFIA